MYMMENLNKLIQVKDSVYKHDVNKEKENVTISDLCDMYPNDADLGREIRILIKNIKNDR